MADGLRMTWSIVSHKTKNKTLRYNLFICNNDVLNSIHKFEKKTICYIDQRDCEWTVSPQTLLILMEA